MLGPRLANPGVTIVYSIVLYKRTVCYGYGTCSLGFRVAEIGFYNCNRIQVLCLLFYSTVFPSEMVCICTMVSNMASNQVTHSVLNWPKLSQIRRKSLAHVKVPWDVHTSYHTCESILVESWLCVQGVRPRQSE